MAESRGVNIIRSGDTSILFRGVLFDSSNVKITSGTTNLRIWHVVPTTGALETFDFDDDLFKAGAITTATASMTHQTAENGGYDTGLWTFRQTTLTDFEVGDKYVAEISHSNLDRPITAEFQYGDLDGDQETQIPDATWDEDIVAAHGGADTAGLLLRALGALISQRTFNPTLSGVLGVPDTAITDTAPGQVWEELSADHNNANTMGEIMNTISGGVPSAADVADAVWNEDIVAAHGTADTAGLLLRALGALISQRANAPTLHDLLNVADSAGVTVPSTIADATWDEDIVAAHSTSDTAGLLLRALGALISQRANSPTLSALLGVPDTSGATIAWTIADEVVDGANHTTANSVGQRLTAIDTLTEVSGSGDLAEVLTQARKLDTTALSGSPDPDSAAGKLDALSVVLTDSDIRILVSLNIQASDLRIEVGVEQFGIIQTVPWVDADVRVFNQSNSEIITVGTSDFGAIGPRGFFTFTKTGHGLAAGQTYQALVTITDGALEVLQTTKPFKIAALP